MKEQLIRESNMFLKDLSISNNAYEIYDKSFQLMLKQRTALLEDNWEELELLTREGLYQAFANLQEISRQNYQTPPPILDISNQELKKQFKEYLASNERAKVLSELEKRLLKIQPNIEQEYLDQLKEIDLETLFEDRKEYDDTALNDDILQKGIEGTIGLAAKSITALKHVYFHEFSMFFKNENYESYDFDFLLKETQEALAILKNDLDTCLRTIYSKQLTETFSFVDVQSIGLQIEKWVPKLSKIQSITRNYALFLKENNKGTKAERIGKLSVIGGDLQKAFCSTFVALYALFLEDKLVNKRQKIQAFIKQTRKTGFYDVFPNGKNVEIAKLKEQKDKSYVEVSGFVKSITARRDGDGKLLTNLLLEDPSSGAEVEVVAIYVHLRHQGLQVGSYCQLSGAWKESSNVNKGKAAIEIEKLSVNELAKKSWQVFLFDWVEEYISRWSGNLNIQFGLGPHISAFEGDKESSMLGAGELIFQPII